MLLPRAAPATSAAVARGRGEGRFDQVAVETVHLGAHATRAATAATV